MKKNKILEIKNLFKKFGKRELLLNLNLEIYEGEIIALVGKNGVGKTTLFKILINEKTKNYGEIAYLNNSNQNIAFLYQERNFDESLIVFELLKIIKWTFHKNKEKLIFFEYLYNKLEIEKIETTKLSKLSGGEKQKLALFQTIVHIPKILFLDEYGNNVDQKSVETIKTILLKLSKEYKTSIIFSAHKAEDIINFADKIYTIKNKKINKQIVVKNSSIDELEKALAAV